jgi:hypothetical protein
MAAGNTPGPPGIFWLSGHFRVCGALSGLMQRGFDAKALAGGRTGLDRFLMQ